jgi:serine/threonine-protein kinase
MSAVPGGRTEDLPATQVQRLDQLCDRFEAAWKAGQRPRIEDYLGAAPEPGYTELLRELIRLDVYYRRRAGDVPQREDYQGRFPTLDPTWLAQTLAASAPVGPSLPGYEIVGELGRGGMGVVYKARQIGLNRTVALKMILAGDHAGPEVRARFRAEAEAVARLQHPHIVQIHEVGEEAGRPFFSLEFVDGGSLADRLAGTPLPAAQAAQLAETLARAMHYAHQRGLVHRDLKPANVLLTADGTPKVTDFGLAKCLGELQGAGAAPPALTQTGAILGTPSYMAPEQAGGQSKGIGPAADVYALGALLYELLTGRPPFRAESALETLRQVQSAEPVPPRQLQPGVPRDLETICLQCLRKEPKRRYPSAAALADDLRRFRDNEPIQARPAALWERAGKWARRRPAVATLLGVSAVAVAGLVLGGAWYQVRLQTALQDALQQRQRTEEHFQRAEENFQLAQAGVDRYLNAVTEDRRLKEQDFLALRKKLLETALPFYEQFARAKAGDSEQQAARGRAYHRLALVRQELGERVAAVADYEQMRDVYAQLAADFPAVPDYRQELAWSHNNLGILLRDLGKLSEAAAQYRRAIDLQEQLAADFPTRPDYRQELAGSHHNLGLLLADLGKGPEAEAEYRRAGALKEQLAAAFPTVPLYRQSLAKHHHNLGMLLAALGKGPEAEAHYRKALALGEKLATGFPTVPDYRLDLAKSHNSLGLLLNDLRRQPEAEADYRKALALRERLVTAFPNVPDYRQELAGSHNNLGNLLAALGKRPEAEVHYRRALALREQLAAVFPTVPDCAVELGGTYCNLGKLVCDGGEPAASLSWYAKAHATLRPVLDREPGLVKAHRFLRNVHFGRALALDRLGRHAEAVADWEQALALNDDRSRDREFRLRRWLSVAGAGQPSQATAAVEELLRPGGADQRTLYGAACVYAEAVAQASKAAAPRTSSRRAEQYARRAVGLLRQAVQEGWKDVAHMQQDAALDALRPRPDFRQLLADLEAKAPGK